MAGYLLEILLTWFKKYLLFPNYTSTFISSFNCLYLRHHNVIPAVETLPSKCVKTCQTPSTYWKRKFYQSLTGLVQRWRISSRSSSDVYFHYNSLKRFSVVLRLLPTFAGVFRGLQKKKIRARPSFNKSLTNYTSEQSLITGVYDKNIFRAIFPFSKCQEPGRRERLWNDRGSFYWIYRVSYTATQAK